MDSKKIGKTIANLRKAQTLTQSQLAEKIMVSDKAISKWETGEGVPDISNLLELAKLFNVPVDYIINGSGSDGIIAVSQEIKPSAEKPTEKKTRSTEELDALLNQRMSTKTSLGPVQMESEHSVIITSPKGVKKINAKIIISFVLAGLSVIIGLFLNSFVGLALSIIGLVLSKTKDINLSDNARIAKTINIVALVINLILVIINIIIIIVFGSMFTSILSFIMQQFNNFNFPMNM